MRTLRFTVLALAFVPAISMAHAQTPAPSATTRPPITAVALRAALRGIQLTETQQAGIKSIMTQHRPQLVAARDSMKPWAGKLQAARQQHDTAAVKAARVALRHGRRGVALLTRTALVQVRASLTAGQQTQFDANTKRVRAMLVRFVRTGRRPG